jgi:hypothetical protein
MLENQFSNLKMVVSRGPGFLASHNTDSSLTKVFCLPPRKLCISHMRMVSAPMMERTELYTSIISPQVLGQKSAPPRWPQRITDMEA